MTFEEMKQRLTNIQNQSAQTKMLNSILICFAEIKNQQTALVDIQNKINEIIQAINRKEDNAETVNSEIEVDSSQQDIVNDSTDSADLLTEKEKE